MRRSVKIALRTITTVLVCLVVFFAFSVSAIRLFGFEVYGVLTGSMEPKYPTGSLIYVRKIDTSSLEVGDVISFKLSQNVIATHRIVELVPAENNPSNIQYRTKGDANDTVDSSLVDRSDIIGKVVFCIPQMGYFLNFIQSPKGIFTTVVVSIILILLVFLSELLTADTRTKMRWRKGPLGKILSILGEDDNRSRQRGSRPSQGRQPQRGRPQPRDDYDRQRSRGRYEDDYRPRQRSSAPRYEDERRPARSRSAYEDDYRSTRSRSRYEDDYRPRQRSSAPRYEDDYRSTRSRSRYEDDYRPRQRSSAPRYEDSYRSGRSSSASQRPYSSRYSRQDRYDD